MGSGEGLRHMHRAAMLLENAANVLRPAHPELKRITIGGDLRRGCELIADLAIVAAPMCFPAGVASLTAAYRSAIPGIRIAYPNGKIVIRLHH